MAGNVKQVLKLQIEGGGANPAPPLGPTLSAAGVDIQTFCSRFNEATQDRQGELVPVEVTVYEGGSFDFDVKKPLAATLIKRKAGIEKGSGEPNREKVGKLSDTELEEIAKEKMEDLNARDLEGAKKIIEGTARSMGIEIQ